MEPSKTRRSDRISIELPLEIFGDDINRFAFSEKTRTAVITRHGAKIYSQRKLGRDQEVVVRCISTGKESDARIVGELAQAPDGYAYGIEFLHPDVNVWDIEFPPLSQAEQAAGRTLLECMRCHTRELAYLDAVEVEVLDTGQGISRPCKRCSDVMLWKVVQESAAPEPSAPAGSGPAPSAPAAGAEGQDARAKAGTTALIRHPILGDEVVAADNITPSGLTARSIRRYRIGAAVEVALPYTKGGANIFVAARIEYVDDETGGKFRLYELEYISPQDARARE